MRGTWRATNQPELDVFPACAHRDALATLGALAGGPRSSFRPTLSYSGQFFSVFFHVVETPGVGCRAACNFQVELLRLLAGRLRGQHRAARLGF